MKKPTLLAILFFSILLLMSWILLVNQEMLEQAVRSSDVFGPVIIIAAMIIQSVIAPIPAVAVALVAGSLYGIIGAVYVGVGALVGAVVCFSLSRKYGKRYVEERFNPQSIDKVNSFIDRHGFTAIFLARLIPLFSFDLISYTAGVTKIRFRKFFLATFLGMIPGTIFYVELGELLSQHPLIHFGAVFAVLATLALIYKKWYR